MSEPGAHETGDSGPDINESALSPVRVKTIARVGLGLVAIASVAILLMIFGPLGDRRASAPDPGARDPQLAGKPQDAAVATGGSGAPPAEKAAAAATLAVVPSFDVVRIEPNGEGVIAGRAAPNAVVELVLEDLGLNGRTEGDTQAKPQEPTSPGQQRSEPQSPELRVLQRAVADRSGLFAMTSDALPPGAYALSLRVRGPDGAWVKSAQTVHLTVQPPKPPLVALMAPDRPTVLISSPDHPAAGASQTTVVGADRTSAASADNAGGAEPNPVPPAKPVLVPTTVRVSQVEADDDGRLFVVGTARPGATVRLYLNDALLASGLASASGVIEFALQSPLPKGDYRVRLDMVDPATGTVLSRAEAPWENRGANAVAGGDSSHHAGKGPSDAAIKAVPVRTHVVARGDSLWSISRRTYHLGSRFTTIYDANQDQIRDANRIYPGQVFVLPQKGVEESVGGSGPGKTPARPGSAANDGAAARDGASPRDRGEEK